MTNRDLRQATDPHPTRLPQRRSDARARATRKWRDAAAILTVLGVILFASPLVSAIGSAEASGAVPLAVQYVFDVWAILIAAVFVLARLSPRDEDAASALSSDMPEPPATSANTP